jgi:D-alanyl-lipoteichoic acid acyltransferase DltB (MBOAT superfamily)
MLFNSLNYAYFLPIVFIVFWFFLKNNLKLQNIFLLAGSYFFYGFWDYRFLFLLVFSTLLDYFSGIKMENSKDPKVRKTWFLISIIVNLGFLGVFKYYNFFIFSFSTFLENFGLKVNAYTINVILPVGISFYTFHGLSYVIDIYNRKIKVEKNIIDYALFVSYFPLLVAGPIERATHLLPQLKQKKIFNYSKSINGLKQILWGLFKKIVIADNCAPLVNDIFYNFENQNGSTLFLGGVLFAFQIYGDFSGYSDIALGSSRLFGIELLKNFNYPYFSRDIAEFWRRWHISLTTWFRDYVYFPLGGSKNGLKWSIINTFIIFIISGIWHGAGYNYILWGLVNAVFFMPLMIFKLNRNNIEIVAYHSKLPSLKEFTQIIFTFLLVVITWIFFRITDISDLYQILLKVFSLDFFKVPAVKDNILFNTVIFFILFMIIIEFLARRDNFALDKVFFLPKKWTRWLLYYILILCIIWFGGSEQQFIYFQF